MTISHSRLHCSNPFGCVVSVPKQVHGEGTFKWPDGREYVGQWQQSRMHGRGVYSWPDGRSYEGQSAAQGVLVA